MKRRDIFSQFPSGRALLGQESLLISSRMGASALLVSLKRTPPTLILQSVFNRDRPVIALKILGLAVARRSFNSYFFMRGLTRSGLDVSIHW